MKQSEMQQTREGYIAPSMRIFDLKPEQSFLQSNFEPIGGGDIGRVCKHYSFYHTDNRARPNLAGLFVQDNFEPLVLQVA